MFGDVAKTEIRCKGRDKKKESRISGLVWERRESFGNFGNEMGMKWECYIRLL